MYDVQIPPELGFRPQRQGGRGFNVFLYRVVLGGLPTRLQARSGPGDPRFPPGERASHALLKRNPVNPSYCTPEHSQYTNVPPRSLF